MTRRLTRWRLLEISSPSPNGWRTNEYKSLDHKGLRKRKHWNPRLPQKTFRQYWLISMLDGPQWPYDLSVLIKKAKRILHE